MLKKTLVLTAVVSTLISGVTIAQTWAQTSARSDYRIVNVNNFVSQYKLSGLTPNQSAVKLFGYTGEEDGRKSEQVAVTYPTRDTALIMLTTEGLANDSVNSLRNRIEMRRTQNKWQVVWVGEQNKCQKGRGSQTWTAKICS
ncbi:MAG: hypothetical protein ACHBN1_31015 [Heteroscytonema crispum UTEX LB 1556]